MRPTSPIVVLSLIVAAAQNTSAQKPPAVHFLDRPIATSAREFKNLARIRQLPNGNLLVNDVARRQLLLLDSALKIVSVVADSTPGSANSYGATSAGLLPYPGDSSLLVLPRVPSMYMIDPQAHIVRVMSVPRPQEAFSMVTTTAGTTGFDAKGRLVYRGNTPPATRSNVVPGGPPGTMIGADSAPIVRVDLSTHAFDTAAMFKLPQFRAKLYPRANNSTLAMIENNPVPTNDDWAVLSDGTIAVVRGQDYHVDFINVDGTMTRGPKMAYAWEPLNDDAKAALMDSVRKAIDEARKKPSAPVSLASGPPPSGRGATPPPTGGGGGISGAGVSPGSSPSDLPPEELASLSDIPDYRPPFTTNAVRPDADGNLWIRTTHREASAGTVYDVVNRAGKVIDRVQLQPGRSVLGFGPGGIVYVIAREEPISWIEKSKWKAP